MIAAPRTIKGSGNLLTRSKSATVITNKTSFGISGVQLVWNIVCLPSTTQLNLNVEMVEFEWPTLKNLPPETKKYFRSQ